MYLLAFFILQNLKKILRADPELWGCAIFGSKMAYLSWTKFFVIQAINTFIYLLALFIVQNFKKFFRRIQSYEDAQFLHPKWPISPNENFFQKTCLWNLFLSFKPIYMPKIKVRY